MDDNSKKNMASNGDDTKKNNTNNVMHHTNASDDLKNEEPEVPLSFCEVSDDYFDDAVFIGDSRVVSLYEYSDWKEATYYCSSGMNITEDWRQHATQLWQQQLEHFLCMSIPTTG